MKEWNEKRQFTFIEQVCLVLSLFSILLPCLSLHRASEEAESELLGIFGKKFLRSSVYSPLSMIEPLLDCITSYWGSHNSHRVRQFLESLESLSQPATPLKRVWNSIRLHHSDSSTVVEILYGDWVCWKVPNKQTITCERLMNSWFSDSEMMKKSDEISSSDIETTQFFFFLVYMQSK